MRTLEVEEDIYAHLLRSAIEIGERESSILRRLLGLAEPATKAEAAFALSKHPLHNEESLAAGVANAPNHYLPNVVDKYLFLLSKAAIEKGAEFVRVGSMLGGRERKYFAGSSEEIEASGLSTQPRRIPGTALWALTNSKTSQKRQTLRQLLKALGYSDDLVRKAVALLR